MALIGCLLLIYSQRYYLFDIALANEYQKSGLTEYTTTISNQEISYATNCLQGISLDIDKRCSASQRETIVMLHGFAAQKEYWLRLAAKLSDKYHIIIVDLLGHGASSSNYQLPYTIDSQVEFINRFLSSMGILSFHMIGNSMGAMVSSHYAVKYKSQIKSLSLISPAGIYDIPTTVNEYIEQGKNPLIVSNLSDLRLLIDLAIEKPPFIPWPIDIVIAEKLSEKKIIQNKIFKVLDMSEEDIYKDIVKNIDVPTFIAWGDDDRIVSVDNLSIYQLLIKDLKYKVYKDIGHAPMIEVPKILSQDLGAFINNVSINDSYR